jgi:glutathione S-transferase
MSSLILHHYETSPFSEKVRLILGAKGLAWQSVIVPTMLPKPDVMALTGGYRRTPFMQIGADIYCDTALMCRVIDAMAPHPPLYPGSTRGLAEIVAQWADGSLFWIAVPYTIQPVSVPYMFAGATPEFLRTFAIDRAAMTPNIRRATIPDAAAQLRVYLGRLENMLADGRRFLLGAEPCIADFSAAQSIWFMRRSPPIATMLDAYPKLVAWYEHVGAFGHSTETAITSEAAIAIAANAVTHAPGTIDADAGFSAGDSITVTPTDYAHDPVAGHLVGLTCDEVVIERIDARAGRVHVHFPRIGFQVLAGA